MLGNKKILFVLTNYRVCEKIMPVINNLPPGNVDILLVGLMSPQTPWVGDPSFNEVWEYTKYFQERGNRIIRGPGISYHGDSIEFSLSSLIFENYDLVVYDDNRPMPEYKIPELYQYFKSKGTLVVGNSHGNEYIDNNQVPFGLGVSYDKVFVLSEKEKSLLSKIKGIPEDRLIVGGIPANDSARKYDEGHCILVVANFLGNRSSPFKPLDREVVENLYIEDLADTLKKSIVVKIKPRLDGPSNEEDVRYVKSLFKRPVQVISSVGPGHTDNIIAGASYAIAAPSTLNLKILTAGIPTLMISEMGQVGNLLGYPHIYSWDLFKGKNIHYMREVHENIMKWDPSTQPDLVAGMKEKNATQLYINELKKLI